MSASRHQDHAASPSAETRLRQLASPGVGAARLSAPPRPPHPALNTRDDRVAPLCKRARDGLEDATDFSWPRSDLFFAQGLDKRSKSPGGSWEKSTRGFFTQANAKQLLGHQHARPSLRVHGPRECRSTPRLFRNASKMRTTVLTAAHRLQGPLSFFAAASFPTDGHSWPGATKTCSHTPRAITLLAGLRIKVSYNLK
jgi:hypothetical protein